MSQTITFGIVGGYGASGRVVVSELWKTCNGELLIGGRDLAKGKALAAEFESRVSAAHLDVLDARSLDDFCSRCSICRELRRARHGVAGSRRASGVS